MNRDPYDEEVEVLGRQSEPPPDAEDDDRTSTTASPAPLHREPSDDTTARMPTRPGLQPKLHAILVRETAGAGETTGTFARAEASLLHEGVEYDWPVSEQKSEDFDGSGEYLAERMTSMITKAGLVSCEIDVTALTTKQPMLKPLPDAPRDHDKDASDLVVVSNGKRFLYANKAINSDETVPYAYAVSETSVSLLKSSVSMQFKRGDEDPRDDVCKCGAIEMKTTAWFDPATGCPKILVEHPLQDDAWGACLKQPTGGWTTSGVDLCRVLQVSTWPEHEVRALQAKHVTEYVAPFDVETAALALFDKHYKTTILVDVLDAKLGSAIIKSGTVSKPALFCADRNTRLWMVRDMAQSTLIDNQVDQLCTHAMAMAKRGDGMLKLIVNRLKERSETAGWPDLLKPSEKQIDGAVEKLVKAWKDANGKDAKPSQGEMDAMKLEAGANIRLAKLCASLKQPHLRPWYDGISLHQHHTAKMLLKRIPHCGMGGKAEISPFNPPTLLPFSDGQLVDFGIKESGGIVRRIEQADLLTKTLQYSMPDMEVEMPKDLNTATDAELRTFGTRLGDEEATIEYARFMKMYYNYEGGVMYKLSVVAKALVGDTFLSSLYVQLGARKPSGEFIQGAGKGMTTAIDQLALGEYAESFPLALLFYKEKMDGACPGFAKLEAKRYVLVNEANQQQDKGGANHSINQNMLRRLVPQGPEEKLSARQLYEGFLDFYAQIISLVVNLNDMHAGLMAGRRAQAVYISPVFLPPSEYDKWTAANHDANVLSADWRDAVIAVAGVDGKDNANVHKGSSTNPYDKDMWERMAKIHLACATLFARRCVRSGKWPAVPEVNEQLTRTLLEEEANRASAAKDGVVTATLQRLTDAWYDFAVPCPTKPKTSSGTFHACECKRGDHERWCLVGAEAFTTWLSMNDNALAKEVHVSKGASHVINLLKSTVPGLQGVRCERVRRGPSGTPYGDDKHRVRSAIMGWCAKSGSGLSRKESKKPVARAERPSKRKSKAFGAEHTKKQKTILRTIQGDEIMTDVDKGSTPKNAAGKSDSSDDESDSDSEDDPPETSEEEESEDASSDTEDSGEDEDGSNDESDE